MVPECFGWFDNWDDYCWYNCPYSRSCEYATYGYSQYGYYDEYWF